MCKTYKNIIMKPFTLTLLICSLTISSCAQGDSFGSQAITLSEFIYKSGDVPFPSCHASTIAETADGLVAAWFGGTAEKNPDVGIWVSRFSDGKWTIPVEVANGIQHKDLRYPTWNPVLFNTGTEIKLFYKVGPDCSKWWGEVISSDDNGKTWSNRKRLPEGIWGPIKNKPVLLENGFLLCPSSTEYDGWRVHMERTADMGETWERTEALNGKEVSAIQPTVLIHPDGKLQILNRSKQKQIFSSWSSDFGQTWSNLEPIQLPNPNSGIDAVTLKDGRHVLIYNHIKPEGSWGGRNMLNLAVSEDGITWNAGILLENDSNSKGEYSYPAVIQTSDGMIHITYTWKRKLVKHVVVNPAKLKTKPIIDAIWPED
jgi:predicted neuraminidase